MRIDEASPPPKAKAAALKWAAASAGVGAVAAVAVWLAAGAVIDRGLAQWRADMAGRNVAVTLSATADDWPAGFPLTARRRFADVEISAPGLRLSAAAAEIAFSPLRPHEATLTLRQATAEQPDGGKATAETAALIVDLAQQPLNGGGTLPRTATLRLEKAIWRAWAADSATATLRFPETPPADHQQPGLFLTLAAEGVAPPVELAALAGPAETRGSLALTATVTGAPPALTAAALEAWRTDGGVIELAPARAGFASLDIDADATLALDRELQWIGAGSLRVAGADAALAHAVRQSGGPFKPKDVKQARQVAAMLTQPDRDGGPPRLTLPLSVQDRRLFLGPFQLAKLPQTIW